MTSGEVAVVPLLNDRPHVLYRMYDRGDRLLYVGITADMSDRIQGHREGKGWWGEVVTIRLEHYPNRLAALRAEKQAISSENPVHNISPGHEGGRTPHRTFRVDDEPWAEFCTAADLNGTDASALLRAFVDWYTRRTKAALPRSKQRPTVKQVEDWKHRHPARKKPDPPTPGQP